MILLINITLKLNSILENVRVKLYAVESSKIVYMDFVTRDIWKLTFTLCTPQACSVVSRRSFNRNKQRWAVIKLSSRSDKWLHSAAVLCWWHSLTLKPYK